MLIIRRGIIRIELIRRLLLAKIDDEENDVVL